MQTEAPVAATVRVGNDVVDLVAVRRQSRSAARRRRFLDRVFSPSERERLQSAGQDVELLTWAGWAAKETVFKIHSKLAGERPVFHHARYETHLALAAAEPGQLRGITGSAIGEGVAAWVTGWTSASFLHLAGVGHFGEDPPPNDLLLELGMERFEDTEGDDLGLNGDAFTSEEVSGIRTALSARVRILARRRIESHLARLSSRMSELGPDASAVPRIEIRTDPSDAGRSPPVLWVDGAPAPSFDLSLSHHGGCVAWALLLPFSHAPGGESDQSIGR
jgi:phosphopantetheine--protein transferase-like protein